MIVQFQDHHLYNRLLKLIFFIVLGSLFLPEPMIFLILLLFLIYCFFHENKIYASKISFLFLIVCCIPFIISFFWYIDNWKFIPAQASNYQLYYLRKYCLDLSIGFLFYILLKYLPISKIVKYIYQIILLIFIIILSQFILGQERPSALFPEPSSLAFFIISFIWLVFHHLNVINKTYSYSFLLCTGIISLIIMSKILIIFLLMLSFLVFLKRKVNLKYKVLFINTIFIFIFWIFDNDNIVVQSFINFLVVFYEKGLYALNTDFGVYGTFVTRLSSIYLSIISFLEYPFGIGLGSFSYYYVDVLERLDYDQVFYGSEIARYSSYEAHASQKSALLSFLNHSGIFGLFFLIFFSLKLYFVARHLFLSFLFFLFAAFFLELNNFYMYIFIYIILFDKTKNLKMLEN